MTGPSSAGKGDWFELANQLMLTIHQQLNDSRYLRGWIDGAVLDRHGFESNRIRHQLLDLRHRVWFPLGNGLGTRVEPALGCAIDFHLFGDGFPVVEFGLIHGNNALR